MAKWDIEFSEKENDVIVDHDNILEDRRKEYKGLLVIKVFQVHVEVPIDKPPPKTAHIVKAAEATAEAMQEVALKDVDALAKELMDLQKEEQHGNKKAAETAKKLVEKVEKSLKKMADEFGPEIRKAVQKSLLNYKGKLSSTSRTVFRGMELDEDAFEEDIHDEIPNFYKDIVKLLVDAGNEAYKLCGEEVDSRMGLAKVIQTQKDAIDELVKKSGQRDLDMTAYGKDNAKDVLKLAQVKEKYVDAVKSFESKLETAIKALDKLEKLSDTEAALKANKAVNREYDDFRKGAETILKTLPAKLKAAALADDLFSGDWKGGAAFAAAARELGAQESTHKAGKQMQEAGKSLEKLGKA